MRSLVCLPFSADLNAATIKEIVDPSLLIFPTLASASQARRLFQPRWQLEEVDFISMEQLRQMLLPAPHPELQDEKRLLCLWQVLDETDKETFHLYSYDDLVSWGQSFLSFFAEMRDELVDLELLQDPAQMDLGTRLWQEEHLKRVLAIRQRYHDFILAKGFTDSIFYLGLEQAVIPFSARKLVFVNQYYFSKLEKLLVERLEANGCDIVFLHQGPQGSFDPLKLESKPLELSALDQQDIRLRELKIIQAPDQDQMALACLCELNSHAETLAAPQTSTRRVIVDGGFASKSYSRWFDPQRFRFSHALSMHSTRLYQLLSVYATHLKALAAAQNQRFLPLAEMSRALAIPGFCQYYLPHWTETDRHQALDQLRRLAMEAVLYIDLDLNLFAADPQDERYKLLIDLLGKHFALLDRLSQLASLEAVSACFDTPNGLDLKRLCSPEELASTDILDRFYERLANFGGIEELGLVADWKLFFNASGTALASGLWKLWMDHLAGASVSKYASPSAPLYDIANLMDSRNLQYDEVIVLNCVEGILPSNPEAVWLLNEVQRKKLGLKHFELVRQWERYYFLRLVLGSQTTTLYCYRDEERDLDPGSYLSELEGHLSSQAWPELRCVRSETVLAHDLLARARAILHPGPRFSDLEAQGLPGSSPTEDFFSLPCQPEQDFGTGIKSAYYGLSALAANPFAWYIQNLRGLKAVELLPRETISPMLFGTIMHSFLTDILLELQGQHQDTRRLRAAFQSPESLSKKLRKLLGSAQFDHKLPQNYNRDFLFGVISDCLVRSVRDFYYQWLEPNLYGYSFRLIPEQERMTNEEWQYKTLLSFGPQGEYKLEIHGKADLRISLPGQDFIVDFKTGKGDAEQLIFYEYFYYRLDPEYQNQLNSLFWMILDARRDSENLSDKKRQSWRDGLIQILDQCLSSGYGLGTKATDRERLKQITRADLWKAPSGSES